MSEEPKPARTLDDLIAFATAIANEGAFKKTDIPQFMKDLVTALAEPPVFTLKPDLDAAMLREKLEGIEQTRSIARPMLIEQDLEYGPCPTQLETTAGGNLVLPIGAAAQFNKREALALGAAIMKLARTLP